MSDIQIFKSEHFGEIRTLEIDGQIYFVGVDVANALGYTNPRKAIKDHVAEDNIIKRYPISDSLGRVQHVNLINESGLYSLIMSSKLPNAKEFKHLVISEVLPEIRRTGGYGNRTLTDKKILDRLDMLEQRVSALENKYDIENIVTISVERAVSETVKALVPYIQTYSISENTGNKITRQSRSYQNSKMSNLPQEVKYHVDEMIVSGRYSCQKIAEFIIANTGISISYMTVSRYIKKYFKN